MCSTSGFPQLPDEAITAETINSEETRRKRLFSIYLEERLYKIRTLNHLFCNAYRAPEHGESNIDQLSSRIPHWVEEMGCDILNTWCGPTVAIEVLKYRIKDLEEGCQWFSGDDMQDSIAVEWCRNQILEMVSTLNVLLNVLALQDRLPSADLVRQWFNLMNDYGFFEEFQPVS